MNAPEDVVPRPRGLERNSMKRASSNRSFGALVIGCLWLAGCAGLAYQYMNDPSRDAWQKPKEVMEKLAIKPGSRVADLGAGGGYFTWYLAGAVGPKGTVYAVEINEHDDAKLPEPVDLVFTCDAYHHMEDRVTYFRLLLRYLKPDGRVAILDFHPHGFVSGLLGHGTAKEVVRREMESAGYRLTADSDLIDDQHFQIFFRTGS
jgi:predicted methyltransferase